MKISTPLLLIITTFYCLPLLAQNLEVDSGGQFYVSPTAFVYVGSDVNIVSDPDGTGPLLPGSLILDSVSDNFSDLFIDGSSTGAAEYRHFTGSSATRDLVSPPVSGQTFASFAAANSGKISQGSITTANLMYGPLDNMNATYVEYAAGDSSPLIAAKGYRAGSVSGQTLTYEGTINTSDMPVAMTYGSASYQNNILIGNPYTTHLDSAAILTAMDGSTVVDQTFAYIYGYDGDATSDSSTWKIINSMSNMALPSPELITPGQAFIMISSPTAGGNNFTFPKSSRVVSPVATDNFITGRAATNMLSSLKLKLTKGTEMSETSLYFIESNGSRGLDVTYDAGSLGGSDIGTHLVEDSEGYNLAIQVLSYDDLTATDYVIPIEVNVAAGQEATISIDNLNVPLGTEFFLEDSELNTKTLLTSNNYIFTPSSTLSGIGRFYLRTSSNTFSNAASALNSVEILSLTTSKKLVVRGQLVNDSILKLYDIRGRIIDTYTLEASQSNHMIDVSNISSGIYIVNLNNKIQSKTNKLIIK
jgi:hypothetical protein